MRKRVLHPLNGLAYAVFGLLKLFNAEPLLLVHLAEELVAKWLRLSQCLELFVRHFFEMTRKGSIVGWEAYRDSRDLFEEAKPRPHVSPLFRFGGAKGDFVVDLASLSHAHCRIRH